MGTYSELRDLIRKAAGERNTLTFWQGTVQKVEGCTCTVDVGGLEISGVRLRVSNKELERELLITPKTGSSVILGSLSGDYSNLAVLRCDEIQSIKIGDGTNGGLVNVNVLVNKFNDLVKKFNDHIHQVITQGDASTQRGDTFAIQEGKAEGFNETDEYEDTTIIH